MQPTTRHPRTAPARRLLSAIAAAIVAIALAACGDDGERAPGATSTGAGEPTRVTLVLDFVPNPVHAGIYRALAAGHYRDHGIELRVVQPTATADTLRLIEAGKADFGLADAIDVAGQIDAGRDVQAVLAIAQRPLGGVIALARAGIASGADLEGRVVGVTGVPSDDAVLDTVVAHDGGDPTRVRRVTIGFNGAQNLQSGTVDAFTGYWPADGVQLDVAGRPTRSLKLDEHGGPVYPGLVAFSTRARIAADPGLVRAFAAATAQGYADVLRDPERALADLLRANPSLRRPLARAQLEAYLPLFRGDGGRFGTIDPRAVEALSAWMVERDLASAPIAPARFATDVVATGRAR